MVALYRRPFLNKGLPEFVAVVGKDIATTSLESILKGESVIEYPQMHLVCLTKSKTATAGRTLRSTDSGTEGVAPAPSGSSLHSIISSGDILAGTIDAVIQ